MKHNKRNAFTLIELLVVITIIGIIAAIAIPTFNAVSGKKSDFNQRYQMSPSQTTGCNCNCNK